MNIDMELDRASRKQEAAKCLEHASDLSSRASSGDGLPFQRTSETAQTLAIYLPAAEATFERSFQSRLTASPNRR